MDKGRRRSIEQRMAHGFSMIEVSNFDYLLLTNCGETAAQSEED